MRDRRGYARTLTAGLSLALALFASGCLVAEGTEEDDAPKLAQEQASCSQPGMSDDTPVSHRGVPAPRAGVGWQVE